MSDFEDIRPYHDEEVAEVLHHLVRDPQLTGLLAAWLAPRLHRLAPRLMSALVSMRLRRAIRGVGDIAGFQDMMAAYAKKLVREGATEFIYEGFENLSRDQAYLFISNHRDIAGDSMLLDYALYLNGLDTVRIAIGDNLVQRDFATALMRLNKGFFIKRSVAGPRKTYAALLQSSRYIRQSIADGHSIWIAQSEGRSKDGLDVTDPAVIKMFALAGRKRPLSDVIRDLNIMPLSISYEFDPCDLLKATELGRIEQEGGYRKPPGEDLLSLVKGLSGQKGRVIFRLGRQLAGAFESVEAVAAEIDYQIVSNLELFPVNYWALSKLDAAQYRAVVGDAALDDKGPDKKEALQLARRLKTCPVAYRPFWLQMYANPVINRQRVLGRVNRTA